MIRLKVLHLSNARTWRGGERQTVTLARGLLELGHTSVLACRPDTPLERRARQAGIPLLPLPMRSELDPWAIGSVVTAISRHGFNLLHLHTPHAHTVGLLAARLLENSAERPRVVVARRVAFPMRRHPLQSFKYGCGVDAFVATSYAVRARLTRHGIAPSRIAVIHDGIDPAAPRPEAARELARELDIERWSPRIGHIGHLESHKGQRFLLEAFARLAPRYPRAGLVIVGDGPLRHELEAQVRRLGVQQRVRFAGLRQEVAPAIELFDLLVMPSIQEGLGSIILDALALRKPVCASAAGGIPEIIRDGENGVLVSPQDPEALAQGIRRLLDDPDAARRMAEAGPPTVRERFSASLMVAQTLRLYRLLLEPQPAWRPERIEPPEGPPRRRLTVLHLNTERGWRGGENQTFHLAQGLRRRGHTAILVCQKGGRLEERARREGIPCHALSMRGELDLHAILNLRRLLRDSAPDVVHYHTSHAVSLGTLAALCGNASPTLATKRTSFPLGGNPLSLAKYTFRVDRVVAVSRQVRDLMVREGVPAERVSVIPSGIELERFCNLNRNRDLRARLGWNDHHFVLGSVGHLAAHKGHLVLLEAFARMRRHLPEARLLLVGDGEQRAFLEARTRELGQQQAVHFAGFQAEVPLWLSSFDLFVLPSLSGEGSPAVVKEAMAAGIPVLTSDVAGIREIVEDGVNGRVVPVSDADALSAAALEMAADPAGRVMLARRARASAGRFSMEAMVAAMEETYHRLVETLPACQAPGAL
ncbi:MAG: glycosyltransferase [Acidobacteriota bacterium]